MKNFISIFAIVVIMSTMLTSCFLFGGGELCPAYGQVQPEKGIIHSDVAALSKAIEENNS